MTLSPLAAAMAEAVKAHKARRVQLLALSTAAAAIDRTGVSAPSWRSRVAAAIEELAASGLIELPVSKWDDTSLPRLPMYVTRVVVGGEAPAAQEAIVWHAELGWAAQLDAGGQLNPADRRVLAQVNSWLRRRGDTVVPQRERSLDIFDDEKLLDTVVFTHLFGPGRLTHPLLRCEPCWPPVHQEILGGGPWLVVENWTTFNTLAAYARGRGWDGRLIWGAGNQVGTRLESLAADKKAPGSGGLWYFGDIDTPGFSIARRAAERAARLGFGPIQPATALYGLCQARGSVRQGKKAVDEPLSKWIVDWLGEGLGRKVVAVLADKGKIVQETVGVELLAAQWAARLLP